MNIRDFNERDRKAVEEIFAMYWTDPEFLEELSCELQACIERNPDEPCRFFVAEENGEILGIVGYKKLADYLNEWAVTDNPVELYVIASKYKRKGIGEKLKLKLVDELRETGFKEILLYSPNSHSDSWGFHDILGFERVGETIPPEDEVGQVWRKILN